MIFLNDIHKHIGQSEILRGINLHIAKGEFVAIIGQSGSGKTSLLNIIGTLDEPSSGSYIFENYEVTSLNTEEKSRLRREKIGFIFQRYNLLSLMNASENVALPAVYAGLSASKRNQRAREILASLELDHKLNSKPNELSGGQQQRVSIARALMNGGDLILADEPTGALDSKSGVMVLEILQRLNKEGHTIVLVTHDPSIAAKARRIIEIKDGEIIRDSEGMLNSVNSTVNLSENSANSLNLKSNSSENSALASHFEPTKAEEESTLKIKGNFQAVDSSFRATHFAQNDDENSSLHTTHFAQNDNEDVNSVNLNDQSVNLAENSANCVNSLNLKSNSSENSALANNFESAKAEEESTAKNQDLNLNIASSLSATHSAQNDDEDVNSVNLNDQSVNLNENSANYVNSLNLKSNSSENSALANNFESAKAEEESTPKIKGGFQTVDSSFRATHFAQNDDEGVNSLNLNDQSVNLNENSAQISQENSQNSVDCHDLTSSNLAMTSGDVNLNENSAQNSTNSPPQKPQIKAMPKEVKSYALFKNQLLESLKIAYSSIVAHKLRSLLTMLGIIIGIASVVSVVALGLGSKQRVLESIARLGTNTIEVHGGRGYGDLRSGRVKLALSDLYTLQNLPYLESVEAQDAQSGTATYGNISLSARMEGGGIHIFDIRGLSLDFGRLFNEEEVQEAMNVAVLDDNGKKRLFAELSKDEIIGKTVLFNKQPFKIIGILQKDPRKPDSDINVKLYTPYTTLRNKITGSRVVSQIVAKVSNEANPSLAEEAMIRTLEIKRGQRDFFTINSDSIKQSIEENSRTMSILITSIAIIALVVGGIGVMNIMIVSVSERTREIGIRMAIGARKEDILFQFLIEAIMICMIGAILGVGLSFVVVEVFNALSKDFLMIMSGASVLLGLLSSVIIGLVFGFFPAKNAANLNPINALSKE